MKKLIALTLISVVVSCKQDHPFTAELKRVDSLRAVVDTFEMKLDSVNTDEVRVNSKIVDEQYEFVKNNYPDTTDRDFWITDMNYFSSIKRGFSRYLDHVGDLRSQIDKSQEQLEGLGNSLRDEKLTKEEADTYLKQEGDAIQKIRMEMRKPLYSVQSAAALWDTLQPRYDSIANYIQAVRAKQ